MDRYGSSFGSKKRIKEIPVRSAGSQPFRVAAYCRVSTSDPDQLNSLHFQKWYYDAYIKEHAGWTLAGVYEDIGSGTQIKGRIGFQQMIADCDVGKIDLILTKSIFRFARNTLDALKTIRHLKENGIGIVFDQEGIHTLKEPSEFIIAVLSAYAQNESHSKSKDVRFGLEQSFRNPNSKYYQRICYGYQHNASGRLVIDEQKARTVRLIFMLSADGYSLAQITDELERQRVPSPRGNVKWSRETIRKILANEKYTGNVMLQKTYVADYLTHKQVNNNGQRCRYVVEHNHEAILRNAKPAYNNEK